MYFSNKIVISNCGVIPNIYAIGMYFTYFESPFYPLQITNLLCHDPMTIYYSKWRLKNTCRKLRFSLKIFRSQPILTEKMARSKRVKYEKCDKNNIIYNLYVLGVVHNNLLSTFTY